MMGFALVACSAARGPGAPSRALTEGGALLRVEGTVRAPASERGATVAAKTFLGTLLEQDDGTRWVLEYAAGSPFHELAGYRVNAAGSRYEPPGQALLLPHLRVEWMRLAKLEPGPSLVEVRGEETLEGKLERFTWPEGTKLAGETTTRFVADRGGTFFLAHTPGAAPIGAEVTVTGHRVEPSPFIARPAGIYLWVTRIDAR